MRQDSPSLPTPKTFNSTKRLVVDSRVRSFGYLLCASALMSYVPKENVGTGLFVVVLILFVVRTLFKGGLFFDNFKSRMICFFVAYCFFSLYIIFLNGYGLEEWSRAVVPFLFYLMYLMIPPLKSAERQWLSSALLIAALIWLTKILIETGVLVFQGSDVLSVRLTFRVVDSVLPFPLVAIPYLLFAPRGLSQLMRWALLGLFAFVYVWIGYRAGLVLMALCFAFFMLVNLRRFSVVEIALLGAVVGMLIVGGAFDSFGLLQRFDGLSAERDSSRGLEWIYVWEQFSSSPVVGKGLGWPVPADIAFAGVEDVDGTQASSVGFVHSLSGYLAMDMGLIGLFLYLSFALPRLPSRNTDDLTMFSFVAVSLLLLFCNTQASFRQIQTVLMLVALLRIGEPPLMKSRSPVIRNRR